MEFYNLAGNAIGIGRISRAWVTPILKHTRISSD